MAWKPPGDGSAPAPDLPGLWHARETPERPLVVVLDQSEEAFTRPRPGMVPSDEIAELMRGLQSLFQDPAHCPRGRLILGFRRWLQWSPRIARLGYESLRLGPLDHHGIVEAIEGPTLADDLRRHYGLTIAPGLADSIANELERDAGSALAPTLQVLLAKMWTAAGGKRGSFTPALYDQLKDEGFGLNDVLDEGLTRVSRERSDVVDSVLGKVDLGISHDQIRYSGDSDPGRPPRALWPPRRCARRVPPPLRELVPAHSGRDKARGCRGGASPRGRLPSSRTGPDPAGA